MESVFVAHFLHLFCLPWRKGCFPLLPCLFWFPLRWLDCPWLFSSSESELFSWRSAFLGLALYIYIYEEKILLFKTLKESRNGQINGTEKDRLEEKKKRIGLRQEV